VELVVDEVVLYELISKNLDKLLTSSEADSIYCIPSTWFKLYFSIVLVLMLVLLSLSWKTCYECMRDVWALLDKMPS